VVGGRVSTRYLFYKFSFGEELGIFFFSNIKCVLFSKKKKLATFAKSKIEKEKKKKKRQKKKKKKKNR